MGDDGYKPTLGYAVSIASVALALPLTLLLHPLLQPSVFPLFFAAVTVSAWYGGLGPGLVATVLSAISMDVFLLEPRHGGTINITSEEDHRTTVGLLLPINEMAGRDVAAVPIENRSPAR